MAAEVTVYTTNHCPYCIRVKSLLKAREVSFEEINIAHDPDARTALVQRTGHMTFPQVFVGDTFIGGYDETAAADRDGRLATLLSAA